MNVCGRFVSRAKIAGAIYGGGFLGDFTHSVYRDCVDNLQTFRQCKASYRDKKTEYDAVYHGMIHGVYNNRWDSGMLIGLG